MMYEVEIKVELTDEERRKLIASFSQRGFLSKGVTPQNDFYIEAKESPYGGFDLKRYRNENGKFIYTEKLWEMVRGEPVRKENEREASKEEFEVAVAQFPEAPRSYLSSGYGNRSGAFGAVSGSDARFSPPEDCGLPRLAAPAKGTGSPREATSIPRGKIGPLARKSLPNAEAPLERQLLTITKDQEWFEGSYRETEISITIDSVKFDHSPSVRYFIEAEIDIADKDDVPEAKNTVREFLKNMLDKSEIKESPGMFTMALKKL